MKETGQYECGKHKARGLDSGGHESNSQHKVHSFSETMRQRRKSRVEKYGRGTMGRM